MPRHIATEQIIQLLKEHDSLPHDNHTHRNAIKRQILFLMESVKLEEQLA